METVSKKDVKKYFRDVCEALAYLHSQNIMHRDIKVRFRIYSLRTYFLINQQIRRNCVTLALLQFWVNGKLCVGLMNTCHQKWYKIGHMTIKSTSGHSEYFYSSSSQVAHRSKGTNRSKFYKKWRQRYIFAKDSVR